MAVASREHGSSGSSELRQILESLESVLVCFSGGVDSAYLLAEAHAVLGDRAVALTAISASLAPGEREAAARIAAALGVRHLEVDSHEGALPDYRKNDADRCFHCKSELYSIAHREAGRLGLAAIVDGFNRDDRGDHRPGREAAREQGVRSPLDEAGLGKEAIREGARALGLEIWDKPAAACLASRIPYGTEVTELRLSRVGKAEAALAALGFRVLRVRDHHPVARLELGVDEIPRLLEPGVRAQVLEAVREAGFPYVALDLEGYRLGALNELL
ncbi:MAG: ATP-dependent sacrificial sulfur transferase LarE [Deltaproteobacteria bacterium]|nr:ATP-dependent sacrificial sulfur transferase LarE [Deltaproteobacteria bacterium]